MSSSPVTPDLERLRALVQQSRFAVGLFALNGRELLGLSSAAAALTGLPGASTPVDIGAVAAERGVVVSLRVVAHDDDDSYAIVLFSTSDIEEAPEDATTIETLLGPLRELGEPTRDPRRDVPGLKDLTDRQQEILARLMDGDRVPTISRGMHLSASTIRNHLATLYRKVGVHSQAELIERLHASSGR